MPHQITQPLLLHRFLCRNNTAPQECLRNIIHIYCNGRQSEISDNQPAFCILASEKSKNKEEGSLVPSRLCVSLPFKHITVILEIKLAPYADGIRLHIHITDRPHPAIGYTLAKSILTGMFSVELISYYFAKCRGPFSIDYDVNMLSLWNA